MDETDIKNNTDLYPLWYWDFFCVNLCFDRICGGRQVSSVYKLLKVTTYVNPWVVNL
jgi:hypothetical protein